MMIAHGTGSPELSAHQYKPFRLVIRADGFTTICKPSKYTQSQKQNHEAVTKIDEERQD